MTSSPQPGEGWTASADQRDDAAGVAVGPTVQGFADASPGFGSLSFGDDAATSTTSVLARVDPAGGPPVAVATPVPEPVDSELVTCPECGTAARVTLNRREANDFCRSCDYPLFWTPSTIVREYTDAAESLRRLPGTAGKATIASLPCPHCAERNALSAMVCMRCGGPMHPVQAPPPPPAPAPEPVFYEDPPEPEPTRDRFVWIVLGVTVAIMVLLFVLGVTGVFD